MLTLTRRCFVAGAASAAVAWSLRLPALADAKGVYRDGLVIDGLGALGNSMAEGPLTDAFLQDIRGSGITCVHTTIQPVGTTPPDEAFARAVTGIGWMEMECDNHPDVLYRVRKVADILEAKK